jgi:hypothetical protein
MNWEKLKPNHFFKQPVEHVYASTLYDMADYDKLYENTGDLEHTTWQEFDKKYKTGFQLFDDIRKIDTKREIICVWFFKDRNDRSGGEDIILAGKKITYRPNTFLITESKDIKVLEKKDEYFRRPFLQIDLQRNVWEEILKRFNKIV